MLPKSIFSMPFVEGQGAPFDAMLKGGWGFLCARFGEVMLLALLTVSPAAFHAQQSTALSVEVLLEPGEQFSEGQIIAAPRFSSNETYPIVVDANGDLLHNELNPFRGFNFDYHPNGSLAWYWTLGGTWEMLDSSLQATETLDIQEGENDYHDLELLPNGHRLLLGQEIVSVTLEDSIPDPAEPDRALIDCLIEEQDAQGNVVWLWRASEHIPPTWCTHCFWGASLIDAYHHNAFQTLENGDILLCLRNMDAVVRINRQTSELMWVVGGPFSDFDLVGPGEDFSHPHDAQLVGDNHLLVFDNHTGQVPMVSRGVEYALDEESGTLTQVGEWVHPYGNYASSQGSIQRIPDGGTLIGWGTAPSELSGGGLVTEYDAQGTLLGSLHFPSNHFSYRARKVPAGVIPLIQGCRDSDACDFNPGAVLNGDCIAAGDPCNDGNPCTVGDEIQEDCSCSGFLPQVGNPIGCSDPEAANFDPCAWPDIDDGSCQYLVEFRVDATTLSPLPEGIDMVLEGAPYSLMPGGFGTWKGALSLGNGSWNYHFVADGVVDTVVRSLDLIWPLGAPLEEQRSCLGIPSSSCPGCNHPDDPSFSPFAADDELCESGNWVGCTYPGAINFNALAMYDDGSCSFNPTIPCPGDLDANGLVTVSDILMLLTYFGLACGG